MSAASAVLSISLLQCCICVGLVNAGLQFLVTNWHFGVEMQSLNRIRGHFRQLEPSYSQELLDDSPEDDYLRNAANNRRHTDTPFLGLQAGFLFVLIFFIAYCITYGDIERLTKGYDRCGNVCGKINKFDVEFESNCKPEDMRDKPYLYMNGFEDRRCVKTCDAGAIRIFGHRCIAGAEVDIHSENEFHLFVNTVSRDLHTCTEEMVYMGLLALAFSFFILLVLRFAVGLFVWTVLLGVVVACGSATAYFWYLTGIESSLTPLAIFFSIVTLVILLVIMVMRKRIQLVIQLFKEAGKSIGALPLLVFEPILTFVSLAAVWSCWIYFTLWIESAGTPVAHGSGVKFQKNGIIHFTRWYNHFVMVWMVQFVYGCQNMLLAGAVSTWYFTRNKARLGSPIYNSARNMAKYHLGTISFGSLVIALIHMLRMLLRSIRNSLRYALYLCCLCCVYRRINEGLTYAEELMKYLTRNAYIVTSIHGYPLTEAGTRAFKLLVENALHVLAINSVGDFVLVLAKVLVVTGTVILGLLMTNDKPNVEYKWAPVVVAGVVAYLIAHCFLTVYEMAIDTIFICFCEDCEINDGFARPYFMSHELMEFVEKSKSVLGIKIMQAPGSSVIVQQPLTLNNPVVVSVVHTTT